MRNWTPVAAALLLIGSTAMAGAACTSADLAGSWTFEADKVVCKSTDLLPIGKAYTRCTDQAGNPMSVEMSLGFDKGCKLVGLVVVGNRGFGVEGRVEQAAGDLKPGFLVARLYEPYGTGSWLFTGFRN